MLTPTSEHTTEEALNNQVYAVDISQPLSKATPELAQWVHNQRTMMAWRGYVWAQWHGLPRTKTDLAIADSVFNLPAPETSSESQIHSHLLRKTTSHFPSTLERAAIHFHWNRPISDRALLGGLHPAQPTKSLQNISSTVMESHMTVQQGRCSSGHMNVESTHPFTFCTILKLPSWN